MFFSENEIAEINSLVAEGMRRLDNIENDLRTLIADSEDDTNPLADVIKSALVGVCPETQFLAIKRSRAGLRLVRAKMEIEEFSDSDAEEVCRVLDDVKAIGRMMAESAQTYKQFLRRQAECN